MLLTDINGALSNHGAIDFVNNGIDFLHVVTIGHELVAGNDILRLRKNVSILHVNKDTEIDILALCGKLEAR